MSACSDSDGYDYCDMMTKWTCMKCTLVNPSTTVTCSACGSTRFTGRTVANYEVVMPSEGVVEFQPKPGSSLLSTLLNVGGRELLWACPRCARQNDENCGRCEACGFIAINVIGRIPEAREASQKSEHQRVARKPDSKPKDILINGSVDRNDDGWSCPNCTFLNHRDLLYCEQCRTTPDNYTTTTRLPTTTSADYATIDAPYQQLQALDYTEPVSVVPSSPRTGGSSTGGGKKTPPPRPNYLPDQSSLKGKPPASKTPPKKPPRNFSTHSEPSKPVQPSSPRVPTATHPSKTTPDLPIKNRKPPPNRPPPLLQAKPLQKSDSQSKGPIPMSPRISSKPPHGRSSPKSPSSTSPQVPSRPRVGPNPHSRVGSNPKPLISPKPDSRVSSTPQPCVSPTPKPRVSPKADPRVSPTPKPRSPKPHSRVNPQSQPSVPQPSPKPRSQVNHQNNSQNPKPSSTPVDPVSITSVLFNNCTGTTNDLSKETTPTSNNSNSDEELQWTSQEIHYPSSPRQLDSSPPLQRQTSQTVEELKEQEQSLALGQWYDVVEYYKGRRDSFVDPEFPHSNESLFLIPHKPISRYKVARWSRPQNVKDAGSGKWCVMSKPKMADIAQGALGNCWFLSALAVVVECPGVIEHIMVTKEWCPEGAYLVRLCRDGEWCIIQVDDYFPVNASSQLTFSKARRKQLFVPLIEKAIAKMYGSYEALEGGQVIEGLQVLTGYPCEKFRLKGDSASDENDTDFEYLWTRMLSFKEAGYPMAGCTIEDDSMLQKFKGTKLKPYHAYSILDLKEAEGSERMILLRDPWGLDGYTTTANWWSISTTAYGDGTFWIGVWDFYKFFTEIDICHFIPDWHCFRTRVSLLPDPHQPVHQIYLFDETELTITITQPSTRNPGDEQLYTDMCLIVVRLPDESSSQGSKSLPHPVECVAASQCHILPSVTCRIFVGAGRYAILPLSFKTRHQCSPSINQSCALTIFSSKVIEHCESVPTIPGFVRESLFLCARRFGKTLFNPGSNAGISIFTLHLRPSMFIVLCENHNSSLHCNVVCDNQQSENTQSSRHSLITTDTLPPRHKQILIILGQAEYSKPFYYQFKTRYQQSSSNPKGGWGSVNDPPLDTVSSELHQACPLTQNDSKGVAWRPSRTMYTSIPANECKIS